MRQKLIPILIVSLTLTSLLHGDRDVAPYPYHGRDVGIVFPTTVRKGYYVSFSSCWDGRDRGFHGWDSGEFDPLPGYEGSREIQVRQSEDGINWGDWSDGYTTRMLSHEAGINNSTLVAHATLITGNYVQVRHRVNTTNDYSIFSDGDVVGEWKVFDIDVLPNVPLLDVMDPTQVSLAYFKDYVALYYAPEEWTPPDYFTFPHRGVYEDGEEILIYKESLDPNALDWDYPRGKNWLNAYIQRVNFFRKMAGVMPVALASDEDNRLAQQTCVFYHLNGGITHDFLADALVDNDWLCANWTDEHAWAGKNGILSSNGFGRDYEIWDRYMEPVVEFMDDQYRNNIQVGHRSTLLNPALDQLAVGGTPGMYYETIEGPEYDIVVTRNEYYADFAPHGTRSFSKNKDFDDLDKMTRDQSVFWPAPGYVPWDVVPARFSGHDVYVDIPDLAAIDELPVIEFFKSDGEIEYLKEDVEPARYWIQDDNDIRARMWINGEEVDVTVCWGSLDTRYRRLDFVIQVQDYATYDPDTGEVSETQTLFDTELRETYPDHDEIAGGYNPLPGWSNSLYFGTNEPAAMYPRPKYGPDYIHIELYLVVDEERQAEYGLQPTYDLLEYDVYPFDPMVVFSDDYYATDEAVLSEKFGWYNADKLPWIYSFEQKSWMYVTGVGDNKWIYDAEIGWFYQPSYYPWVYSQDLGQWIYYMDTDGDIRRYASETGEIITF